MTNAARRVPDEGSCGPNHAVLITPDYIELQKELRSRYDYGKGVDAPECAMLVRGLVPYGSTVLDYGCGQGHFSRVLGIRYEIEEYDPCIEGKDEEPARVDVVVCADVLEHVEPECLDNVLLHIRALTRKYAILVIATRPSDKIMADGRSAHLIVEDAGFWFQKLTGLFNFERFDDRSDQGRGLLIVCTPRELSADTVIPIARVRATPAVDNAVRNANVRTNCARTDQRLKLDCEPHDGTAHLACFGPSLRDTWPSLAMARARGEAVYSVSGAHDFLIERGIIPYAHLDCDPRAHKVAMLTKPHHDVRYWLASCVDPSYLDRLDGYDVSLWHSYNGDESREAFRIDPGHRMIIGGGSVGLRSMSVLYCRGYRSFEIHGMDCSFSDREHHAGPHLGKNNEGSPVRCGERWFTSNPVMLVYARYFRKQVHLLQGAKIKLHGDGLLQHMVKLGDVNGIPHV